MFEPQILDGLTPNDRARLAALDPVLSAYVKLSRTPEPERSQYTTEYCRHIILMARGMSAAGGKALALATHQAFSLAFAFPPCPYVQELAQAYEDRVTGYRDPREEDAPGERAVERAVDQGEL